MDDTKQHEPAFPRDHAHDGHNGISMLDYFATKAPAPPIGWMPPFEAKAGDLNNAAEAYAVWAYLYAKAMLRARGKI